MPKTEEVNNKPSIWFLDPSGENKGGKPEYEEGANWIMDYQSRTGTIPTAAEYNAWKTGQDVSGFHFSPESTMGKLGWGGRTMGDVRRAHGSPYGPGLGELVPSNAVVFTDQYGKPLFRSNQISGAHGGYLDMGQYYEPPTGFDPWQQTQMMRQNITPSGGYPGGADMYRSREVYTPGEFRGTTPQLFADQATPEIYGAQLQDYLDRKLAEDYDAVQDILNRSDALEAEYNNKMSEISKSLYENKIDENTYKDYKYQIEYQRDTQYSVLEAELENYMYDSKAQSISEQSASMIGKGMFDESLPFFNEARGMTTGKNFMNLWNQLIGQERTTFEESEQRRKQDIESRQELSQPPTFQETYQPGERDRYDYQAYVSSLGLASEWEDWLYNKFNEYYTYWMQSGRTDDFISWISKYLAGEI